MAIVTPGQYAGTSFAAIDGKGRIAVPSQFRNNVPLIADGQRVLWVGFHEKLPCLVAYGQDQYDRLNGEIERDRETARLFSIAPGPVFRNTFFIASATGAVGGIFLASYAGVVRFDFGVQAGLIGFSAAVVGGLGRLGGAIVGSLLIAAIETIVQGYVPNGTSYRLVFVFALVILVLIFRPAGLFGVQKMEKV